MRAGIRTHGGADPGIGQDLEQQRAPHAAVDDVDRAHALAHRRERGDHARLHFRRNDAIPQQRVGLARREDENQLAVAVVDARHVGHQYQLFRVQRPCELSGEAVGVDVIGRSVRAHADGHDDRNEAARDEQVDDVRVDALDFADETEVGRLARSGRRAATSSAAHG